jgi:hypothetical protein
MHAAIDHCDECVEHVLRYARSARRHSCDARHQHRAHGSGIVGGADGNGPREDGTTLVIAEVGGGEPLSRVGAECRIDAVGESPPPSLSTTSRAAAMRA